MRLGGYKGGRPLDIDDPFETAVERCLGDRIRADPAMGHAMWSAMANVQWQNSNGNVAIFTFRAAADLVAAIRREGDYIDWYCRSSYEVVAPEIASALAIEGWSIIETPKNNCQNSA